MDDENIALAFQRATARDPAAPALRLGEKTITHGELDASIAEAAALLRDLGVVAGDRVGLILPNVGQFAILYYAILQVGAVAVPISVLLRAQEMDFCLDDAEARVAFVWMDGESGPGAALSTPTVAVGADSFSDAAAREATTAKRLGEDTAVIIYTSGTTGRPKGAQLTHRNLGRNAAAIIEVTGISAGTVALGALPLSHSFGQTWLLNATLGAGGCISLLARFSAERAAATIALDYVTFFAGVPTMFAQLLDVTTDPPAQALDLCVSGGAAMGPELMRAFEQRFRCIVREGYGLSETSPLVTLNPAGDARRPGSVGLPIPGVEVEVTGTQRDPADAEEPGEIVVRGHNVMKGYWKRPEATAEAITADGWFRTGDLGYVDADGYLVVVGRKRELIIRGGYNVYPREVEEVLLQHPAVAEAAVIGIEHPTLGEEVAAAVRLQPGFDWEMRDLMAHARSHLASYKYPRLIWPVEQLPLGPTGKVLKRLIERPTLTS